MNLTEFKRLVEKHGAVTRDGANWRGRCPAHDDDGRRGDLTFRESDGKIVLHCWGGCSAKKVAKKLGLEWSDLFSDNGYSKRKTPAVKKRKRTYANLDEAAEGVLRQLGDGYSYTSYWTYHDADGADLFYVLRFDSPDDQKSYRPVHLAGDGFILGDPEGFLPLYRLVTLLADMSSPVFVTEGEEGRRRRDVHRPVGHHKCARGPQRPQRSNWKPLAGRDVVILPDNNGDGQKYADDVTGILLGLNPPARVKVVKLPGLPDGGDLADYVDDSECEQNEMITQRGARSGGRGRADHGGAGDWGQSDRNCRWVLATLQ